MLICDYFRSDLFANDIKNLGVTSLGVTSLSATAYSAYKVSQFAVKIFQVARFPCFLASTTPLYAFAGAIAATYVLAKVTLDCFEINALYAHRFENRQFDRTAFDPNWEWCSFGFLKKQPQFL
ncbi:MAG: hypothetical protein ACI9S8_002235 [Chlamydiales bacterium]|jgi:hypothetical protein